MKYVSLMAVITALFTSAHASSTKNSSGFLGLFTNTHPVAFDSFYDEKTCLDDNGEWLDGVCVLEGTDTLSVDSSKDKLQIDISSVHTNGHSCGYQGSAIQWGPRELRSYAQTEVYDHEKDEFVPSVCTVRLVYEGVDLDTVNVYTLGNCQEFCGARAALDFIEPLKKNVD